MNRAFSNLVEIDDYYIDPDTYVAEWEGAPRCLEAALTYAARGWAVFPAPRGTKKSHKAAELSDGRKWGKASDPDQIRHDFERWPEANVGIPAGEENGFWVLEADTPEGHGVDGIANLRALEAEYGKLPVTLMAESPSGSIHYYFKYPIDSTEIRNSASEVAPGIDVRGQGGMVLAPPSVKAGTKNGAYTWISNVELVDAPDWLIEKVKMKEREPREWTQDDGSSASNPDSIAAALAATPSDNYQVWFENGCALHREIGYEEGFKAFDGWSRKSKKYHEDECKAKWEECAKITAYTIGAIYHHADAADPSWREHYFDTVMEGLEAAARDPEIRARTKAEFAAASGQKVDDDDDNDDDDDAVASGGVEDTAPEQQKAEHNNEGSTSTSGEQPGGNGKRQLLFSSAEFVAGFVPPDYLIDGMLLRKNVYALTGRTGDGKTAVALRIAAHVAAGLAIAGMNVEKGRVVFFAGENPDDVRARWVKLCEEMKLDPDAMNVFFLVGTPPISTDQIRGLIEADVAVCGPITLLIVDTSAAYYSGDDENDNKQMGEHARMLRSFVNLAGNPTVLVTCHPTKNPDMTNLQPRGGGAFIAEIDGNLVAIRERGSTLVEIDTHGKFRGPEFAPFSFKLVEGTSERLKDSKGRLIWTVFATPVSEAERAAMEDAGERKRSDLLRAMASRPASSIAELATTLGWTYGNGRPNRTLVYRLLQGLLKEKLVEKKGQRYVITRKGRTEINEAADDPNLETM
jgi:Bifunctional DNA primase/polymerase, N-terminal/AAA domain/Primase C terminal 2 (PriCT-2)